MIYVDSSAIVKLIRPEAESVALAAWLNVSGEPMVTSTPAEVEVRSLDALPLATAEMLVAAGEKVTAFVTYDARQASAAVAAGFVTVAPGRE